MRNRARIAVAMLGLGGLVILAFASTGSAPSVPTSSGQAALTQAAASERLQTFAFENMYCASCLFIVRGAMERVEGVRSVTIDFASQQVTVVYDPAVTTIEAIAAVPTQRGFPARPLGS
ncbi:heavy-metal-associated domain-containing protein [Chelativorans xinjiangense]|uniref:heavy-metal-associated domain-containing protein n=1 Tax=Chelativorans xinjiangense TaxID=2681485 RepID=UPI001FE3D24C|nr:heavy metal-associated domain-containing protein [Chelativorans xinjiangense]